MPPTSNVRKASTTTATNDPNRRQSTRQPRATASRPANYYARPFGSQSAAANDEPSSEQPGFYPALQYFTDAITALPKEVMRQFTLMKEVEAKVHGPTEKMSEISQHILSLPVPPRRHAAPSHPNGLLSFTASNSANASHNGSVVNGMAPNLSSQRSADSIDLAEDATPEEVALDNERRKSFYELRYLVHHMITNLDEKNVVLSEANRVLSQQLSRVDSVWPHVENEVSEEARLGSMTHWAYADNRQKKTTGPTANERARRDVAATNSLAAAASAVHENEIAQARGQATRDAKQDKRSKRDAQLDSDFDDRPAPKKTHAKTAKAKAVEVGLGITTNGGPVKRRKVADKSALNAPAMERSMSGALKGKMAKGISPRSTPAAETAKKVKAKPVPPPKKRGLNSAHASPALASSPLHSSFALPTETPAPVRPQSSRIRQNSSATNLQHSILADKDRSRPASASGKTNGNGAKTNGKRKSPPDEADKQEQDRGEKVVQPSAEADRNDNLKREDTDMQDAHEPPPPRSEETSGKAGRASATGTPRNETFPSEIPMLRTRSNRSLRTGRNGNDSTGSSTEPPTQGPAAHLKHRRNGGGGGSIGSHLVKQLAPFNRSPVMSRDKDDMDDDLESLDEPPDDDVTPPNPEAESQTEARTRMQRADGAVPTSQNPPSPPADAAESDVALPDAEEENQEEEEEEEDEEHDPDDPNEPKYCYCQRGSYGEMVACDNEGCTKEWFHLGCTELREAPGEDESWFCRECRPRMKKKGRGRGP